MSAEEEIDPRILEILERNRRWHEFEEPQPEEVQYRLASLHKTQPGVSHSKVLARYVPLIAVAVARGTTHPVIAEAWLERRVYGSDWERVSPDAVLADIPGV